MKCNRNRGTCPREADDGFKTCAVCRKKARVVSARRYHRYKNEFRGRTQAWRKANPDKLKAGARRRRVNLMRYVMSKLDKCVDCGCTDKRILEFDHVRGEKVGSPMAATGKVKADVEIAKCEVRCPNCHTLRHYLTPDDSVAFVGRREVLGN